MQLIVRIDLGKRLLILPYDYRHIVQKGFYDALTVGTQQAFSDRDKGKSAPDFSGFIHDYEICFNGRGYKPFVYSDLLGKCAFLEDSIVFEKEVYFAVRSLDPYIISILRDGFQKHCKIGRCTYKNIETEVSNPCIEQEEILIKMTSPICLRSTLPEEGEVFYSPDQDEFYFQMNQNFIRRYQACCGPDPEAGVQMEAYEVSESDKCETYYIKKDKKTYIESWYGVYKLRGQRKYLDFLFQTGLGSKTAQGFGMFEILE